MTQALIKKLQVRMQLGEKKWENIFVLDENILFENRGFFFLTLIRITSWSIHKPRIYKEQLEHFVYL